MYPEVSFPCHNSGTCQVWEAGQGKDTETCRDRHLQSVPGRPIKDKVVIPDPPPWPSGAAFIVGAGQPLRAGTVFRTGVVLGQMACCFPRCSGDRTLKPAVFFLALLGRAARSGPWDLALNQSPSENSVPPAGAPGPQRVGAGDGAASSLPAVLPSATDRLPLIEEQASPMNFHDFIRSGIFLHNAVSSLY